MRQSDVDTILTTSGGDNERSNEEVIREAIENGTFYETLQDIDTGDLEKILKETKRDQLIADIICADTEDVMKAIQRMGWGDSIVEDIAALGEGI